MSLDRGSTFWVANKKIVNDSPNGQFSANFYDIWSQAAYSQNAQTVRFWCKSIEKHGFDSRLKF